MHRDETTSNLNNQQELLLRAYLFQTCLLIVIWDMSVNRNLLANNIMTKLDPVAYLLRLANHHVEHSRERTNETLRSDNSRIQIWHNLEKINVTLKSNQSHCYNTWWHLNMWYRMKRRIGKCSSRAMLTTSLKTTFGHWRGDHHLGSHSRNVVSLLGSLSTQLYPFPCFIMTSSSVVLSIC